MKTKPLDVLVIVALDAIVACSFVGCGAEAPDEPHHDSGPVGQVALVCEHEAGCGDTPGPIGACDVVASCTYFEPSTGRTVCDEMTSAQAASLDASPSDACLHGDLAAFSPAFSTYPCAQAATCITHHDTATGCDWRRCIVGAP